MSDRPRGPVAAIAGCIIVGGGLVAWLYRTPNHLLREQLTAAQFWHLEVLFALVVVTGIAGTSALWRALRLQRRDLLAPAASSALAALLVFGVAPHTNRIYYDEQIYQSIGQNLSDLRRAQMCNDGTVEYGRLHCRRGEYNKQPYGYPHLLSVGYRVFGVSDSLAHALNGLAAVAMPWVVYLITFTWFGDHRAAAFASLVAALIPEHLLWSHTAASEPTSAFVAAWSMLALAAFIRFRSTASLAWLVVSLGYAVQFRAEMPLLLFVAAAVVAIFAPGEIRGERLWLAALAGLVLCSVAGAHLVAVRHEGWGTSGDRLSLAFLGPNLRVNGWFYLWDSRFPPILTILATLGLLLGARSRAALVMLIWFGAFWSVYLLFYAGSYNYGADVRYSLLTYPPLMVLAGVGAGALARWLDRTRALDGLGARAVCGALLFQALWYLPHVRAVGEEAWAARADVAFAEATARQLPPNAIVLTHNPGMFHVWGIDAAQLSLATAEPDYVRRDLRQRYAGGVFIHWNFWCNVSDPVQNAFCRQVLESFETEPVAEFRAREYRYAFYRIQLEKNARQR